MTTVRSVVDADGVELTLELPDGPLVAGSTVEGTLTVRGRGTVGPVAFALFAAPPDAGADDALEVTRYHLTDAMAVDGVETVPVTVAVPHWTPVTRSETGIRAVTGFDPDPTADGGRTVSVESGPVQTTALDALADLGFVVRGTRCVAATDEYGPAPGPVQLFECVPEGGPFERRLDRLDVAIRPDGRTMTAYLDVHREGGLFSEVGGEDGRTLRVAVEGAVPDRFHDVLSRHV